MKQYGRKIPNVCLVGSEFCILNLISYRSISLHAGWVKASTQSHPWGLDPLEAYSALPAQQPAYQLPELAASLETTP